jgi:hypothetical protein
MERELREIFLTYVELMRRAAREAYDTDLLIWAVLAAAGSKVKRPEPPAVLRAPKIVIGG